MERASLRTRIHLALGAALLLLATLGFAGAATASAGSPTQLCPQTGCPTPRPTVICLGCQPNW